MYIVDERGVVEDEVADRKDVLEVETVVKMGAFDLDKEN